MRKFSTSTYLKALGLVALGLYFTNCAPKGMTDQAKLKAHCLESMDPKADFIETAEKLSENAKVRVVTADYKETTLRDDIPLEGTSIDSNVFMEKPVKEAKAEVSSEIMPEKYCGSHQIKLADGTIARISSISKNHLEATWSKMSKTADKSQELESMNSITYRYVIDPETKHEHLEITEHNLHQNRKKMVKKNVYIGESLTEKVKMNASVLQALSTKASAEFIRAAIPLIDTNDSPISTLEMQNNKLNKTKADMYNDEKLTLTPEQMDIVQNQFQALENEFKENDVLALDPETVLTVDPQALLSVQGLITSENTRVKINERTDDVDQAEVRLGDPSVDKSVYNVKSEDENLSEDNKTESEKSE